MDSPASLPYPLPEHWPLKAARPVRLWVVVLWALIGIVNVVAAYAALLRGDTAGAIVYAVIFSIVGAALGVSYERDGGQRDLPELLNAVVLGKAVVRPTDSWIHFFRERATGVMLTVCFTASGLLGSAAFAWAGVQLVAAGAAWWLLLVVPLLLGMLVIALAGCIAVVIRYRHSSFGRRPIGISMGRHGVIRYYLDDIDEWSWDDIVSVRAAVAAVDETTGDAEAKLVITVRSDTGPDDNDFAIGAYRVHPWVLYCALRFWAEHPEHRDELSTTFAQHRMEQWRDAMPAARG